jgi:hypothetical protein
MADPTKTGGMNATLVLEKCDLLKSYAMRLDKEPLPIPEVY